MSTTDITIPTDATDRSERSGTSRSLRAVATAVAGTTIGFGLGFLVASITTDADVATAPAEPAATVEAPARRAMSPDALDRWSIDVSPAPTARSMSPDALERWHAAAASEEAEAQARRDQAACERMSMDLADC